MASVEHSSCFRLDKGGVYVFTVNESALARALDPRSDGHEYLILMEDPCVVMGEFLLIHLLSS